LRRFYLTGLWGQFLKRNMKNVIQKFKETALHWQSPRHSARHKQT
jgi:hypothetical protein